MGYKKSWDVVDVVSQINRMTSECSSTYTDGFTGWGIKQDLYKIKEILNEAIRRCPTYAGEEEWLKEQEQERIIDILKK